ncbi:hypothetical protein [Pseudonocardia sp. MH-G8]|uniref:hypothetical protein n=1 Tax=Pseudonocardia sp. MH-G8 TaxID=1854588 RepID=UPI001304014F|nr:hypothetical protein [Pseudonocardia sp. MH-G8]
MDLDLAHRVAAPFVTSSVDRSHDERAAAGVTGPVRHITGAPFVSAAGTDTSGRP